MRHEGRPNKSRSVSIAKIVPSVDGSGPNGLNDVAYRSKHTHSQIFLIGYNTRSRRPDVYIFVFLVYPKHTSLAYLYPSSSFSSRDVKYVCMRECLCLCMYMNTYTYRFKVLGMPSTISCIRFGYNEERTRFSLTTRVILGRLAYVNIII